MDVERPRLLVDVNGEQVLESFVVGRRLEALPCRKDRDGGDTFAPLTSAVAAKGNTGVRWKEVTSHFGIETSREGDDRRAIGNPWIRVIDDHRSAGGKSLGDQLFLPALRLPVVPHDVLADQDVRAGKAFTIER